MVIVLQLTVLQLDLLQLALTDWANYRTNYNIIAANYSCLRYYVAPSKPCKLSSVLAKATQLTAVQAANVILHALSDLRNML